MDDSEATSLEQIRAFLAGSGEVRFAAQHRDEVYAWTERTLVRYHYAGLGRREKGLLRRYIARMTGLSRAQGNTLDHRLCRPWLCEGGGVPTQEIRDPLHEAGRGTAGLCRQESREPERAGDEADIGAGVQRIRPGGL